MKPLPLIGCASPRQLTHTTPSHIHAHTHTLVATLSPGVAGGATLGQNRNLYQGLFMSSGVVGESLKGANLVAEVLGGEFGLPTNPAAGGGARTDIIQAVQLGTREVRPGQQLL
jgi:cystathionine beta-lyase family protein involved in aluminum resistance